ncbi:MAG: tetratricopeptide repeat protein [Cyclobacteriaceae bacterium]
MRRFFYVLSFFLCFVTFGQGKYQLSEDHYEKALNLYRSKSYGLAREEIDQSIRYVRNAKAYYLSGLIYEGQGKELRAVADYEATIKYDENFSEAYFQKGIIYLKYHDPQQAIRDFTFLLNNTGSETRSVYFEIDPIGNKQNAVMSLQNLEAKIHHYRGQAYQKNGEYDEAMLDFEKAIELDANPDYLVSKGLLAFSRGDEIAAIHAYKKAIQLQPDHQLAWYNLVLIDPTAEIPEDLVGKGGFGPTLSLLAARALAKKDYDLALEFYNKAIAESPDGLSLINRGRVLTKLGKLEEARSDFEKARYVDPSRFEAFYLIGNTFFFQDDFEEALAYYNQYLSIDPEHAMTWYNGAMAYLELDMGEEACNYLSKAQFLGMNEATILQQKYCQ